ncbi:MAG: protein kinase [Pirellulaceae bacterium]|nr:MAG: protein kinase [Pirellulaceae bacterium]
MQNDLPADDQQLAAVLDELSERVKRGEPLNHEALCRQYPQWREEITQLFQTVLLVEMAARSSPWRRTPDETAQASGPPEYHVPCRFGKYELIEELGRGGMGVVYRARQMDLPREVALKMMLPERLASATDRERFRAEAEAVAKLDHPGIVPVYDVGQVDDRPYIAMKYIRGPTLSKRLEQGPLAPREAAWLAAQAARAVHAAHQAGIWHRDLKPSNILLDEQNRPIVTDFGLAKQQAAAVHITGSGALIGTPLYAAPEQAAGARGDCGPASDVYSLGCILYHMLTGRPPFQAATPGDLMLMVLEQEPVPPRVLNPKVDRDLEMITLRCLQKPPDLRYPSAAALAEDLEAYLRDEPPSARSGRLLHVLARLFRETHHAAILENWGLLWMWHSLVLVIVCGLTNLLHLSGDQNRWHYMVLWTVALWAWAAVFWLLRRRMGPVLFVERQIAHIWFASMISIAAVFPLEWYLGLPVLTLSPMLGVIGSMVFWVKAGILAGSFYIQAVALLATAVAMARWPDVAHLLFGLVSGACFFFPGLKYYRQKRRGQGNRPGLA